MRDLWDRVELKLFRSKTPDKISKRVVAAAAMLERLPPLARGQVVAREIQAGAEHSMATGIGVLGNVDGTNSAYLVHHQILHCDTCCLNVPVLHTQRYCVTSPT